MRERDLFLMSDAALRDVIDMLDRDQLSLAAPQEWTQLPNPTLRTIVGRHAFDEAWVPDVLAGRTSEEVGERWNGDLLGDDPIESYDDLNDIATEAVMADLDPARTVHFLYGDYPLAEGLVHLSIYRAFQAWSIAHFVGLDFHLPDALVDMLWDQVLPMAEMLRGYGVFPPEIPAPAGADKETQLLCKVGFWQD
ncbi:hypothetical protein BH09ACT1_BH09ACT1_24040 [soil metagenome]